MAAAEPSDIDRYLAFFRAAEALKDTMRSGHTHGGRRESTAEHTWRLCLMALTLETELAGVDVSKLLRLLIVHDLGEAISGDVPAPEQVGDKTAEERRDLLRLTEPLPEPARDRLLALWDEYNARATPEARLAKGLDRLETVLQHTQGDNPADFDIAYNLAYGRDHTDGHPLIAALRAPVDVETELLAARGDVMRGLDRFVTAQAPVWTAVEAELSAGRKQSHWMWFIFPQIAGLGRSAMAARYAIEDIAEARAYLAHPVLGARLRRATELVLAHADQPAERILGGIDAVKFRSSMTLFAAAAPGDPLFPRALADFFEGTPDPETLARL